MNAPQANTRDHSSPDSLILAMLAGLGAALLAGIAWTVIMALTGYEIGYAAWALGGFVGFAMSRTTARRGGGVAAAAAGLALAGLVIARLLIGEFVLGSQGSDEVLADPDLMTQAAVVDLQITSGFPPALQAQYDAIPEGDTISDALWEGILAAAAGHLEAAPAEERERIAQQFAGFALGQVGPVGRLTGQLSAYDLLWVFLAVSTAWGMMLRGEEEPDPHAI